MNLKRLFSEFDVDEFLVLAVIAIWIVTAGAT